MLTPDEIARKQFAASRLKKGYAEDEVDAFLELVERDWTAMLRRVEQLETELRAARQPIPAGEGEPSMDSVKTILMYAQQTADKIQADAEDESANIRVNATREAATLVNEAQEEAVQIRGAATAEASKRVDELNAEAGRLEGSVAALEARESAYRNLLMNALKSFESELNRGAQ